MIASINIALAENEMDISTAIDGKDRKFVGRICPDRPGVGGAFRPSRTAIGRF